MHANSPFKNGCHVGLIQVLGIRLTLIWASHKIWTDLMSFPHSKLTVKTPKSHTLHTSFLIYTGCKLIREDYINYIARENQPADYNSFLSASKKIATYKV